MSYSRKDIYEIFAEPVDPEEVCAFDSWMYLVKLYDCLSIDGSNGLTLCVHFKVEDYYEIIEEPMDFGTMRAKLHEGLYTSLEQFEVFQKVPFLTCPVGLRPIFPPLCW